MNVTVETTGTKLTVSAPYDPQFPPHAKRLGGRWNPSAKTWGFDSRDEPDVRGLLHQVYGTDGSATTNTVDIQITLHSRNAYNMQELRLFSRRVASRRSRDEDIWLGEGVVLKDGTLPARGGSVRNPELRIDDPVTLEVRDIPASHPELTARAEEFDIETVRERS